MIIRREGHHHKLDYKLVSWKKACKHLSCQTNTAIFENPFGGDTGSKMQVGAIGSNRTKSDFSGNNFI